MMGICHSKTKVLKSYLSNDFLKKTLISKSDDLATKQLKLIEEVQAELTDSSKACKLREEEAEKNQQILLQAIIEDKPTDNLTGNISVTTIKINRLKDLELQLANIKSQASCINEILAELDKVEETLPMEQTQASVPVPVAPIAPIDEEKTPNFHLTLPEPVELARVAELTLASVQTCLEKSPSDLIESIISDLRSKLELALKKAC